MSSKSERTAFSRALTKMLEDVGTEDTSLAGQEQPRDEHLIRLFWEYMVIGEVRLQNGIVLKATSREWITALKWLFAQVDGAPKPPRSTGEPGIVTMEWVDPMEDDDEIGLGADEV